MIKTIRKFALTISSLVFYTLTQAATPVPINKEVPAADLPREPSVLSVYLYRHADDWEPVAVQDFAENEWRLVTVSPEGNDNTHRALQADFTEYDSLEPGTTVYAEFIVDGRVLGERVAAVVPEPVLKVDGVVQALVGYKFPDGTFQDTAGITVEADPTVPPELKDGVDWGEIGSRPPGLDDGDDNTLYYPGTGLELAAGSFSLSNAYRLPQGCVNGQLPAWNGGVWDCADDQDTDTTTFWSLNGNAGTVDGVHVLGTTDNQPLNVQVNNQRTLRLEPTSFTPNIIGGSGDNTVTDGVFGAVISGGGSSIEPHLVKSHFGTIAGGLDNTVEGTADPVEYRYGTISGGAQNTVSNVGATIGGGVGNTASGVDATVGGGYVNAASGYMSVVGGGGNNVASDFQATVAGGLNNSAAAGQSTVCGGEYNSANGIRSTVGGGHKNIALNIAGTVAGGYANIAGANGHVDLPELCGNGIDDDLDSEIDEAQCYTADYTGENYPVVGGGFGNKATKFASTVGGGNGNVADGPQSLVAGGNANHAQGEGAVIGGGGANLASGGYSTVIGGLGNNAGGEHSTVVGGFGNEAVGFYSVAQGHNSRARLYGQQAHASYSFSDKGDAQNSTYNFLGTTADSTPTPLTLDGVTEQMTIPSDMAISFTVQVIGSTVNGVAVGGYKFEGVAQNYTGSIYVWDSKTVLHEDLTEWDVNLVPNSVDGSMDIEVAGSDAITIRWVATIHATEVTFPAP